ncbi:hypothetical protein Tco_0444658 [Tanacetum coccineum]
MPRNQESSKRTVNVEDTSSKAMMAFDGAGFDWSFMADEEVSTNMALMDFSDSEIEKLKKEKESNQIKIDNFENASKSLDKLIGSQISNNGRKGTGFESYNAIAPPPTGLFAPPTIDLSNSGLKEFQQPEFQGYGFKANKSICENSSNEIKKTTDAPIIEDWVSDCDEDEFEVNSVNTAKVNRVTSAVGEQGINAVKSSACWVWRPKVKVLDHVSKNSGSYIWIFDSGCSRHITGNKSYLTDYQEYDGGFVAFAGSSKGGKISRKGKIRTRKLDFEDVYFVKELKFNLFSVSQTCDKKNSVLFTETECLILSPDFKLPDESQVLLKVHTKNNMYSFDLKNVVPSKGLTCLFAKATNDESKL